MKRLILLLNIALAAFLVQAQNPADRDETFNVSGLGTINYGGVGQQFSKVTPLPDGKVLVTGSFYSVATTTPEYSRILRLNNDGSFDNTFNAGGTSASGIVSATAIQPDGKILIGGGFPHYNGTSVNGIARINPDGSLDDTFNPGTGFSSILPPPWVRSIAVQPDGKIIVGGGFTIFNGTAIAGVCRLNADGSLDDTFSPGSGPNNIVEAVAIQSDGKIIAGGVFASFNGVSTGKLVRLNTDGSLDNSFSTGTSGDILRVVIQNDGKILTSGSNFYRLETDGSLDAGFSNVTAGNSYSGLALQQDGKIILSGFFTTYLSTPRQRIVRLNTDGTVDSGFDSEIGFSSNPNHLAIRQDGKILVYGGLEYKGVENMVTRIMGTPQSVSIIGSPSDKPEIRIYPNPASHQLTIDHTGTEFSPSGTVITLFDMQGKKVLEKAITNVVSNMNIEGLQRGVYFLRVESRERYVVNKLVID